MSEPTWIPLTVPTKKSQFQSLKESLSVEASEYLEHIVSSFNKKLFDWHRTSSSVPQFSWRYGMDELKELLISSKDGEDTAADHYKPLVSIVSTFNDRFKQWRDHTACTANFMWISKEDYDFKELVITEIDMLVYRKPAPSEDLVKAALKNLAGDRIQSSGF